MGTREAKSTKEEVDDVIFKTYSSGVKTNRLGLQLQPKRTYREHGADD